MFKLSDTVKVRTVCKKCKRVVICIDWEFGNYEYVCEKCGYSTLDKSKVERIKVKKNV